MFPTSPSVIGAHHSTAAKPVLRGWMHLVWFELSLVAGTATVIHASGKHLLPLAIYAAAVCTLFGTSALYHRGHWRPAQHALLQRLDHAMIFLLIAGSATPVFAFTLPGATSATLLAVLWALTAVALVTHLCWMHAPEVLVGSTYIGLGLLGAAALPSVWVVSGPVASLLLAAGGGLYITGAILYHRRDPDPWPAVFGYHEVFHSFVCAGATMHYVAIACLIR